MNDGKYPVAGFRVYEPFSCLPNILKCWQRSGERRLTNCLVERADDDLDIIICPAHKVYCDDAYIHVL